MFDLIESYDSHSGGWVNPTNEFGLGTDPNFDTYYLPSLRLNLKVLNELYRHNPLARRVILLPANDATRKGYQLLDKENPEKARELEGYHKQFRVSSILHKMIAMREAFGGAAIYMDVNDGRRPEDPLNENSIVAINGFRVVNNYRALPEFNGFYPNDTGEEKAGQPRFYRLNFISPTDSKTIVVHESRIIRFPDYDNDNVLDEADRAQNLGWADSTLQVLYDVIKRYGVSVQSSSQLLQTFIQDIFYIDNFRNAINDKQKFQDFFKTVRKTRQSMKATILDGADKAEKLSTPNGGMSEIHESYIKADVAMATGIPLSLLFSNESGGLGGSTISGDRITWYDSVSTMQVNKITPVIDRFNQIFASAYGDFDLDSISVSWNPLHELSEKEVAEIREIHARTMGQWVDRGFPVANAIDSAFGAGEWDVENVKYDAGEFEEFQKEIDEADDKRIEEDRQHQLELKTATPEKVVEKKKESMDSEHFELVFE